MHVRLSHGVVALLATTALSAPAAVYAQDVVETTNEPAETTTESSSDDTLRQEAIVIRGAFIPDEKRETSEISSLLDAGDFSVQGDSDVAGALRRVTGVSVADSKFVYVRGLNERYSSSTLNGSPLPSPEPLRRVAPLDLFPTSVLESLIVQKTYSPEYSAEFGGGNVDIRTKAVPQDNFLTIGGSLSGNTETSFQDGLLYDGGDSDWTGFDDGTRELPSDLETLVNFGEFNTADLTSAERLPFSEALTNNSSLLVAQQGYVGPDVGLSATGGSRFDVSSNLSVGLLGALSYGNEWSTKEGQSGISFFSGTDTLNDDGVGSRLSTTNAIETSGLASIGFDLFNDHEVSMLGFITRSSDKEVQTTERIDNDSGNPERTDSLTWIERQLWTTQIQGESIFPALLDLQANWRASYSEAERDAPFDLQAGYSDNDLDGIFALQGGDTRIRYSNILDDTTDVGIDLKLPLTVGSVLLDLKGGYAYVEKDRRTSSADFRFDNTVFPSDIQLQRIDFAFNNLIQAGNTLISPPSALNPDYSVATLEVDAAYAGFDAQLTTFMRVALGVRYEDSIQVVETRAFQNAEGTISDPIEESRWLPAATLTWNFADDLQLRVGYSETVTRPQFRELSPTFFENQDTDVGYFGNRYLVDAELSNYDARLEYYFGRDQFITVGGFYKDLENVIEEVLTSDENLTTTFVNVPKAELYGIELEYEQILPVSSWVNWSWFASKDVTIKSNYTWSQSELSYEDGTQFVFTSRTPDSSREFGAADLFIENGREMSGQSDHLVNFQIGYTDTEAGSEANLLFNFASERIRFGANATGARRPEVIEQPPMSLDFVYNRDFVWLDGDYSLGLKFNNLLGAEYDWYQEANGQEVIVNNYDLGRSFSISLKRTF